MHKFRILTLCLTFGLLLFATTSNAQRTALINDDFTDNSSNWTSYQDNAGYGQIENGAFVFNFTSQSDTSERYMYPFNASPDGLYLYAPYTIQLQVSDGQCPAGSCNLLVAVGYTEERLIYLEYIFADEQIWLYSMDPNGRSIPIPLDHRRLGRDWINIFDGQQHQITVSVDQNGVTFWIDGGRQQRLVVEANEMSRYDPKGIPGFGMSLERSNTSVYLAIENFTVLGTQSSLEPTATPVPSTPIPVAETSDAAANGFSFEMGPSSDATDIVSLSVSDDGSKIAIVSLAGVTLLEQNERQTPIFVSEMVFARSAAFLTTSNRMVIGGGNLELGVGEGLIEVIDLDTYSSAGTLNGPDSSVPEEGAIDKIQFSDDLLVGLTEFGVLKFWDGSGYLGALTHNTIAQALVTDYGINDFDFNDAGTLLATAGSDDKINIWEQPDLRDPAVVVDTANAAIDVQFRPDSDDLLYTSCDNRECATGTRVVEGSTGDELFALDRVLFSAEYTSDGQYIIGIRDGQLAFFDAESGRYLGSLDLFGDLDYRGISWAVSGPVIDGQFQYYARYCDATDLFGCSGYKLIIMTVYLP